MLNITDQVNDLCPQSWTRLFRKWTTVQTLIEHVYVMSIILLLKLRNNHCSSWRRSLKPLRAIIHKTDVSIFSLPSGTTAWYWNWKIDMVLNRSTQFRFVLYSWQSLVTGVRGKIYLTANVFFDNDVTYCYTWSLSAWSEPNFIFACDRQTQHIDSAYSVRDCIHAVWRHLWYIDNQVLIGVWRRLFCSVLLVLCKVIKQWMFQHCSTSRTMQH